MSDSTDLYKFNGKTYDLLNTCEISQTVETEWRKRQWANWSTKRADEIQKALIRRCYNKAIICREISGDWILFKNEIYDIKNDKVVPYSRDYFITKTLGYDYFPAEGEMIEWRPNMFIKTLKQTIRNDVEYEKFLSFIQYALTTSMIHQKALVILGERGSGKTKLMEFIVSLFGDRATTFDLRSLNGDEGYKIKVRFKNKTLAYSDELGGAYLYLSGMDNMKKMITNTFQSGRAAFGKEQEWNNTVKFVFTTDRLPALEDPDDEGFYRRFEILELDNRFYNDDIEEGEEDNREKSPYDIVLKTEAGQVLSTIARHKCEYDFKSRISDIKEKWLLYSDSVYGYIKEYEIEEITNSDAAFMDYIDFCAQIKWKKPLSQKAFLNRLTTFGIGRPRKSVDSIASYVKECATDIEISGESYEKYTAYCESWKFEPKSEKYYKRRVGVYLKRSKQEDDTEPMEESYKELDR